MNLKRFLALFLGAVMFLGLVGCSSAVPQEPDLQDMSDDDTVARLLAGYQGLDLPAVAYEVSAEYVMPEGSVRMDATVSVEGDDVAMFSETTVGDLCVSYDFVFVNGVLYVNALGVKVKGAATASDAELALSQQLPFEAKDLGIFSEKSLLRREDGSCLVVLSAPTTDVTALLNLSSALAGQSSEDGEEDDGAEDGEDYDEENEVRFTRTTDFFLSLSFSSAGALEKITVGGDVTYVSGGVESQMAMQLEYKILSSDPADVLVTAPVDAAEYKDADGGADEGGEENSDAE